MPPDLPFDDTYSITIDVDWAPAELVADMRAGLDERGLKATFFCTHHGIDVPGHERAIHPNFRGNGDTMKTVRAQLGLEYATTTEPRIYESVVRKHLEYCPEARGVRAHSLYYDSLLISIYQSLGMEYHSGYLLPFCPALRPVLKEFNILEIPIYFNDHFYLKAKRTAFHVDELKLETPGLKVMQFHPAMVFLNAATDQQYQQCKPYYKDVAWLAEHRTTGKGARTLWFDVLDILARRRDRVMTLLQINDCWRAQNSELQRPRDAA